MGKSTVVSCVAASPDANPGRPEYAVWKLGGSVPGSNGEATVVAMFFDEDTGEIEAFAAPVQGTELQRAGQNLYFRIPSLRLVCEMVPLAEWTTWLEERKSEEEAGDEEEPVSAAVPVNGPPAPSAFLPTSIPSILRPVPQQ